MIRKPVWIAILIFILLTAAAIFLEKRGGEVPLAKTTPTATVYKVLDHSDKDVTKTTLTTIDREIVVVKDPTNGWRVISPAEVVDGAGVFQEKISEIMAFKVYRLLDPGTSDEALGIIHPTISISLEFSDGSSEKILIGGRTPIESGYYARLKNGDAVVLNMTSVENVMDIFTQFFATPTPPDVLTTPTVL